MLHLHGDINNDINDLMFQKFNDCGWTDIEHFKYGIILCALFAIINKSNTVSVTDNSFISSKLLSIVQNRKARYTLIHNIVYFIQVC